MIDVKRDFYYHCFWINNIDEKISSFWLVKSSAVFFLKPVEKKVNSVQKGVTNKAFWMVNNQRNSQMVNQIQAHALDGAIDGAIFPGLYDTRAFLLILIIIFKNG